MMISSSPAWMKARKVLTHSFVLIAMLFPLALTAGLNQAGQNSYFVANEGQWDAPFAFKANIGNATYYVTASGVTIDFRQYERRASAQSRNQIDEFMDRHEPEPMSVRGHVLKMNFVNANPSPEIIGEDLLPHYSNYFLGRDSCNWRGHVPHYQRVIMKAVWPGIDVELVAQPEGVETVYYVAPYADPSQIMIAYEGLDAPLSVDADGSLRLQTSLGVVKEKAPWAYQINGRQQQNPPVAFQPVSEHCYALVANSYDCSKELVIDPVLYCSYWGVEGPDEIWGIDRDSQGNVVVWGNTAGDDFPTTPGAYQEEATGYNGFVSKFGPNGDSLIFSTLVAGNDFDFIYMGDVAPNDVIWFSGSTRSPDWPLTVDAFDSTFSPDSEPYLTALSPDGSALVYSSFVGGSTMDNSKNLAVASDGIVYLCGESASDDFPFTANAFTINHRSVAAFLVVFDPTNNELLFSTFIDGSMWDYAIAVRPQTINQVWLLGVTRSADFPVTANAFQSMLQTNPDRFSAFFMEIDIEEPAVTYCSYFGWSRGEAITDLFQLPGDTLVLCGRTASQEFPVSPGAFDTVVSDTIENYRDAFVATLVLPSTLVFATYLGGEEAGDVALNMQRLSNGNVMTVGSTLSTDFPVTAGAYDTVFNADGQPSGDLADAFVSVLSPDLSTLVYSSYLGGWHQDWLNGAHFDGDDTVWIAGSTGSNDLPVTGNAIQPVNASLGDGYLWQFVIDYPSTVSPSRPLLSHVNSLNIFPNPTNAAINIVINVGVPSPVSVTASNVLGQEVFTLPLGFLAAGSFSRTIDVSDLSSGPYVITVSTIQTHMSSRMFITR